MSFIWFKLLNKLKNSTIYSIKQLKQFLQIIMTKINSILKSRKKEIIFILKLVIPKISIININISYDIKIILIYIILSLVYILLKVKRKK